ncbi:Low-density lipoprotein receptor-related protein 2 [Merluccius polli]|uniref:Low-density lipoprotein receptor-related protein 2 n=1 Tax=Merluccius polli TaxID=89951 RepID=A0AA47MT40_MERPO|nr:Low-density lipoprotein receptor-related protein 2 [Merluccius polli]
MDLKGPPLLCLLCLAVSQGIRLGRGDCGGGQFACTNGQCIDLAWRCDGTKDCTDDSDELNCPLASCSPLQFSCLTGGECISSDFVCDGEPDCGDGSDEQRACASQHLVPRWNQDGRRVSEAHCVVVPEGRTCSAGQFTCLEGQCIPSKYRCDRVTDCRDISDENNCNYPQCTEKTCANGACYNTSQHCNGLLDCRDGSDELNCTAHCLLHHFQCTNGNCVPLALVCDHWNDCEDNSDEQGCVYQSCSGSEFSCASGRCIPQHWVCDRFNDCGDYSDEKGCDSNSRDCYPGEWGCPGSPACVAVSKVCDGAPDCPWGADEANATAHQTCSKSRDTTTCPHMDR